MVAPFQLRYAAMDLPLARPFRIARGEKTVAHNLLVEIEAEGCLGRGEAAPNARYEQSQESALAALQDFRPPGVSSPFEQEAILEAFSAHAPAEMAARAALESALWDWAGRRVGKPVRELLGIEARTLPPSSWTISVDDPDGIRARVEEARAWPVLKVKLGGGEGDRRTVEALRSCTDQPFRVDVNEAWSEEEAVEKLPWLAEQGCEMVEQPLPCGETEAMERLKQRSPLPLIADEAAEDSVAIEEVARGYHAVNVKLMKTGGLGEAIRLIHAARHHGLKVMVGCFVESSLGISAASQIAPLADWLDLDGAELLARDPFRGCRVGPQGLVLSPGPGLGVEVVEAGPPTS